MHTNVSDFPNTIAYDKNDKSRSYIRILHAVPDAPNVDVYADNMLIAGNLGFGDNTSYLPVNPGMYKVDIYAAGTKNTPVLTNMLEVKENSASTIVAGGTLSNIGLYYVNDANVPFVNNKAMVRFIHFSPNAPAVDITLPDGTVLFSNVSFNHVTPYLAVDPMNYTLQVRLAGTSNVVLTIPNIILDKNQYYTIYAIGLVGEEPTLKALLLQDK